MKKNKYLYIIINALLIIVVLMNWNELWNINGTIMSLLINIGIISIVLNLLVFIVGVFVDKFFEWFDKKEKERYSFYDWMGNPEDPLDLLNKYSDKKVFSKTDFVGNCNILKQTILEEMDTIEKLKAYRNFLELKTNSPKWNTLMSAFQTILIAVITAALITFLNFIHVEKELLIISYIVAIVFILSLSKAIAFYSSKIDRNKLLLLLVNECIEEYHQSN